MPPKKEEPPKRTILGRSRNNVEIGILGLPNVGKSSFFNVLCKMTVPAENFPFCTIDPNTAKVEVPDERYRHLCEVYKPKSEIAASLTVTDIAGLVRGASDGNGLGNEFLSHVKSVDALYHLCRGFEDEEVTHVEPGPIDPVRDLEIIHNELRQKDIAACNKWIGSNEKNAERGGATTKELREELEIIRRVKAMLEDENPQDVRAGTWNPKEIDILNKHLFITAKPMVYLCNFPKKAFTKKGPKFKKFFPKVVEFVESRGCGDPVIPFSAPYEVELLQASEAGKLQEFIAENDGVPSSLPDIIHAGYQALDLIHYFTAGPDEVRCWTIRKGTEAPGAAGVIHTDFQKNFISADVTPYEDFKECGTEQKCKDMGKTRQQGRNYVVQDGDICFFKFGRS